MSEWNNENQSYNFNKKPISKRKLFILAFSAIFLTCLFVGASWIHKLEQKINKGLESKSLLKSSVYYAAPEQIFKAQSISTEEIKNILMASGFTQNFSSRAILMNQFRILEANNCSEQISEVDNLSIDDPDLIEHCILVHIGTDMINKNARQHLIVQSKEQQILAVLNWDQNQWKEELVIELKAQVFAQFYGGKAILREDLDLGEVPPLCLNSILAIEDSEFLEHSGFSPKAIARAVMRNLSEGRKAQGGSTITQQLVKNYFLSQEKTFSRKFNELFMAIILESRSSKDDILQAYINEIYMGQNGVFQILGMGAASKHYMGKSIKDLNLSECALLAAIINSPGRYDPHRHPKAANARRNLVLQRLNDLKVISTSEMKQASAQGLPSAKFNPYSTPAPYFLDAVNDQMKKLDIKTDEALHIFTSLNLRAQTAAQNAVQKHLARLESDNKKIKENLKKKLKLQAAMASIDTTNSYVQSLVGGRDYKTAPFNRILNAKRQVGSIMKPFVYLTALNLRDKNGDPYSPISLVNDAKFTVRYDKQKWSPQNYDKKHYGEVPLYFALQKSLNSSTANLALDIGLENIVELCHDLGIESELKALPAMSLGAYELHPWEVLQAYASLARFGERTKLSFISHIYNSEAELVFEHKIKKEQMLSPDVVASLISMMKLVMTNGTGQYAGKMGFTHPSAGKTGTTSDYKDSWFAGFTPLQASVAWVGYDNNESHGLTGSSGALPIWTDFMKNFASQYPALDFRWPENGKKRSLSPNEQLELGIPADELKEAKEIELYFSESADDQSFF